AKRWACDGAEACIGTNLEDIKKYKEFQVSPQGEWIDLAIDRAAQPPAHDASWSSGYEVKARIDRARRVWYGEMRIPMEALGIRSPKPGTEPRITLYPSPAPPAPPHRRPQVQQRGGRPKRDVPHAGSRRHAAPGGLSPRRRGSAAVALGAGLSVAAASAQGVDDGRRSFETLCARCHGGDGNGGELG